MKKVLILVLSSQEHPYSKMIETSWNTWDSINVEGVETVYYCGQPVKENSDKVIYFPFKESYSILGWKMLYAFNWALVNKEFDYIARVNSSCYVDKKELIKHIQTLPEKNVFAGLRVAASETNPEWVWGGGMFIMSKDVVQEVIYNREFFDHSLMEDVALSYLVAQIGIPFTNGKACSIDKLENGWRCLCYGSESIEFLDFADIKKVKGQFFYRVKQDYDRDMDEYVMQELFNNLK